MNPALWILAGLACSSEPLDRGDVEIQFESPRGYDEFGCASPIKSYGGVWDRSDG